MIQTSFLLVDEGASVLDQKNADIVEKGLLSNPDLTLIPVSHHLLPPAEGAVYPGVRSAGRGIITRRGGRRLPPACAVLSAKAAINCVDKHPGLC